MTRDLGGGGSRRGASARERQRVIDALCEHYAQDRLDLPEFERRLDRAHRVAEAGELEALVSDLPALAPPDPPAGRPARRARPEEGEDARALSVPDGVGRAPASRVPDSQIEFAFWSGRTRSGSWVPARSIRAVAFMGGVDLDFREALFGPDPVEVHVLAIMGGVEIIVPPGVHVDTRGMALLGGFDEQLEGIGPVPDGAPVLRVTGLALMGGVEVVWRLPGESPRDARRRRKAEARRRLEEGRR
jgi:hypothetical protein